MKKIIFSLFALFGMTGAINAQSVTVDDITTVPGETVTATLNFTCPANMYSGMQIWLTFDQAEGISIPDNGVFTTDLASSSYSFKDGVFNFAAANAVSNKFSTSTATVTFNIDETVAPDAVFNVTITGQLEGSGVDNATINGSFNISMVTLPTVELDENSTVAPEASDNPVKVIVKRTINANEWSTICLPFAMTGEQLKKAFGDDVILAKLNEWSFEGTFPNVNSMNLVFTYLNINDGLEANYPCMIKVSKAISEFSVNLVTIEPVDYPAAPDVIYKVQISTRPPIKYENYTASMYGTFIKDQLFEGALFASSNKFWYVGNTNIPSIKGYRGYFYLWDSNGNSITFPNGSSARITMEFGDGTTDAIESVQTVEENDVYYNLRGLRVETPSKGIFIKNGKKVVVK
jgi:hypothetical protein